MEELLRRVPELCLGESAQQVLRSARASARSQEARAARWQGRQACGLQRQQARAVETPEARAERERREAAALEATRQRAAAALQRYSAAIATQRELLQRNEVFIELRAVRAGESLRALEIGHARAAATQGRISGLWSAARRESRREAIADEAARHQAQAEAARQQAEAEGLTLVVTDNTTGFFGVSLCNPGYPKPYMAQVKRGGKMVHLGSFATAEEAALCIARSPDATSPCRQGGGCGPTHAVGRVRQDRGHRQGGGALR